MPSCCAQQLPSITAPSGHILLWQCLPGMPHGACCWNPAAVSQRLRLHGCRWWRVNIDASDVPSEYALTILSECAAFPRRLVFFLKGTLSVRCFMHAL